MMDTPFRVRCPFCGRVGRALWAQRYGLVRCPRCRRVYRHEGHEVANGEREEKSDGRS